MQAATNIRPSITQVDLASESIRLQANRRGIRHGVSPNKDKNDSGAVAAQPSLRKARKIQPAGFLHRSFPSCFPAVADNVMFGMIGCTSQLNDAKICTGDNARAQKTIKCFGQRGSTGYYLPRTTSSELVFFLRQ